LLLVDGSLEGEVVSAGSGNSGLINRDNSAVGEGLETVESSGISSSIGSGGSASIDTSVKSLGGQVVSTGSGNSGLINGDNSAVGVSDQLGVEVEGTSISVSNSGGGSGNRGDGSSNWSNGRGSSDHGGSSIGEARGIGKSLSLDSQVVSTGSGNSGLINRDNSAVGVSDQLGVEVEGASIAIGVGSISSISSGIGSISSRIGSISSGIGSISSIGNWGSGIAKGGSSSNWASNSGGNSIKWGDSSLKGQVVSTGSSHSGLIHGDNSAVGEGLETVESLGRGGGNTSGKNQKLHD